MKNVRRDAWVAAAYDAYTHGRRTLNDLARIHGKSISTLRRKFDCLALTGHEAQLYADSAYASKATDALLAERGIDNQVQRKGYRNQPLSALDRARNKIIAVTRGRIEPVFGDWKQFRGLHKTRFMGRLKNAVHCGIIAIMHNLTKAARFAARYGLPSPKPQPYCA